MSGEAHLFMKPFIFFYILTEREVRITAVVTALQVDALGGFFPKRLDERSRDEPKERLHRFTLQSVFLERPEKALDVLKKARDVFIVVCV